MRTEPARNIREVNGIEVVDWAPAETALSRSEHTRGKVVTFDNCELLTLADGTRTFGCVFPGCTFTHSNNALMVAANHYSAEHEPRIPREYGQYIDWSLRDLLDEVSKAGAAVSRLLDQKDKLEQDKLSRGGKITLERLKEENEKLKAEIAKLSKVRDAMATLASIGGM